MVLSRLLTTRILKCCSPNQTHQNFPYLNNSITMWNHMPSRKRLRDMDLLREHIIHRSKLSRVSSRIDNTPPKAMSHVKNNLKGKLNEQSRRNSINSSNQILVNKLKRVSSRDSRTRNEPTRAISFNKTKKIDEISRITVENYRILRKIKLSKSYYSNERMKKEYRTTNDLKNRISKNAGRVPRILNFTQPEFHTVVEGVKSVRSLPWSAKAEDGDKRFAF
jgi:hypothetical protein